MAGFKTHITTSTILGISGGIAAKFFYDVPVPAAVLGAGLCSVSGMLPDLDSDSGVPLRESIAFSAAVVPMFLMERLKRMGMPVEYTILAGGALYLFIRFGLAKILGSFTVHRGMFHSFPACAIAGMLGFLICGHDELWERYFFAGAIMLGFMSHLVLDEIWSIDFRHFRLKSSWGTAMKFWGESMSTNLITYALLAALCFVAMQDPTVASHLPSDTSAEHVADQKGPLWRN